MIIEINRLLCGIHPRCWEVNVGGAFCEVYTDKELDNKIDDFVISNNTHPSLWEEECTKGYW